MINKTLLQKRFNGAAISYDQYANVQKKMAHQLLSMMKKYYNTMSSIRILELGCGTGYVTEQLATSFPNASITAVDFAESMITVAKKRQHVESVTFRCEDIEHLTLHESFDVIISSATFQWLNDLQTTVRNLYRYLSAGGLLLFSTFGNQTFQELHTAFQYAKAEKNVQKGSSIGQHFLTKKQLHDVCESITGDVHVSETCYIEKFFAVREFLQSIRKVGATNSNEESYCQSPSLFRTMLRIYERDFREEGEIVATYHALFAYIEKRGEEKK
ncbi:malonyl-ACP O-methyltransferase BioC [Bacillus gaemokensis]|uniref:Malonyl-[acyl-carrier protein] O-methyltransferase n=1 Tax=Bacillus gaemokensis TaxID=574375 RepID=A0A073KFL8_9BACI|nr:malonyl-ACP O-methyltransferase BioC [Bacillus gaemokensis]KEK26054.1 malonyl-CoA O-methyltransferase [Bacillus gaemokensis]KYG38866.1 malonyl-[acyl-carrier protein] O-methyltransferase BioC [Bacillus gaemokensis]